MGWHRFTAAAFKVPSVIFLIIFIGTMIYGVATGDPPLPSSSTVR
jgi:hypothetical protein